MFSYAARYPINSYSEPLADGDAGVDQTVRGHSRARSMIGLIDRGKKDPLVRGKAAEIIRNAGVPAFDFRGEFRAIFDWVRRNIRWTRDPTNKEGIQDAAVTLQWGIGDCDCISILICSLLGSVGARTRLVTISNHADAPEDFSHIFPEVRLDGRWIPVDAGRRAPAWGKGPSRVFRRRNWDVDTGQYEDVGVSGLGSTWSPVRKTSLGSTWSPARKNVGLGMRRMGRLGAAGTPNWGATIHGRRLRGMGRLGQDVTSTGWDWSQFESQLPQILTTSTTGIANIIRASNAPQVAAANPFAQYNAAAMMPISPLGGISSGTLLLGGLLIVGVLAFSGRKGN